MTTHRYHVFIYDAALPGGLRFIKDIFARSKRTAMIMAELFVEPGQTPIIEKIKVRAEPKHHPSIPPTDQFPRDGVNRQCYGWRIGNAISELIRENHPGQHLPDGLAPVLTYRRIQARFDLGISAEDAALEIYHDFIKDQLAPNRVKPIGEQLRALRTLGKKAAEKAERSQCDV